MIEAVIFDMDGVISDTEHVQATAESEILNAKGIALTPEQVTAQYAGIPDKSIFEMLLKKYDLPLDKLRNMVDEKWHIVFEKTSNGIVAMPGAIELIGQCRGAGVKTAVASSSTVEFIQFVLTQLKIRDKFDAIASGDEVLRGKPNPDIFILVAKKLGVKPQNCVVIEDGLSGMIGAKKAGMKAVGLVSCYGNYPADLTVTSLKQLSVDKLKALVM